MRSGIRLLPKLGMLFDRGGTEQLGSVVIFGGPGETGGVDSTGLLGKLAAKEL